MLFLFRSAPEVEKRIHSKFFRKFWEEPGYKRTDLHYCNWPLGTFEHDIQIMMPSALRPAPNAHPCQWRVDPPSLHYMGQWSFRLSQNCLCRAKSHASALTGCNHTRCFLQAMPYRCYGEVETSKFRTESLVVTEKSPPSRCSNLGQFW